jgi:uncharacterized protein YkwD/uncharacterized protein YukE
MLRRLTLLFLTALVFVGAVFVIKHFGGTATSAIQNLQATSSGVATSFAREVLLSSPLVLFGKGTVSDFSVNKIVDETNRMRELEGVTLLSENEKLNAAAEIKVRDMFTHQYFEHISPLNGGGPDMLAYMVSYDYVSIGENLALGIFEDEDALVEAWMNSPGHRANILRSQFQEIGIAVGRGEYQGREVLIAVQEFGRPITSCPVVSTTLKNSIEVDQQSLASLAKELDRLRVYVKRLETDSGATEEEYDQAITEYNTKVAAYNNLVARIRTNTSEYNTQVRAFNACLKSST